MPNLTPNYQDALTDALNAAQSHLDQLNVYLAYVDGVENREDHLLNVQNLLSGLEYLESDISVL